MKVVLLALASAFHQSLFVSAWEFATSAAVAPTTSASVHETLAKTWTITGDDTSTLRGLQVFSFGRVFVDYDSSLLEGVVAKVVFSGNSSALLDAFELVSDDAKPDEGITIRIKNENLNEHAYLLTQISVRDKQAINAIETRGTADVIVGDDVLVESDSAAALSLRISGSGDLYTGSSTRDVSLASLVVMVDGAGDAQVLAQSLVLADSLQLAIDGSGDVGVLADTIRVNDTLSIRIDGAGDAFVEAAHVSTTKLSSVVAGVGDVTVSRGGVCHQQTVSVSGAGDVATGSIQCLNTDVNLMGAGDVLVQTSANLTVSSEFSIGDVRYFGAKPASVVFHSSGFSFHHKKTPVEEAKKNRYKEFFAHAPPSRNLSYIHVQVARSIFSSTPQIDIFMDTDSESDVVGMDVYTGTLSQAVNNAMAHPHAVSLLVVAGVVAAAVGVAVNWYKHRKERARYQSLI